MSKNITIILGVFIFITLFFYYIPQQIFEGSSKVVWVIEYDTDKEEKSENRFESLDDYMSSTGLFNFGFNNFALPAIQENNFSFINHFKIPDIPPELF